MAKSRLHPACPRPSLLAGDIRQGSPACVEGLGARASRLAHPVPLLAPLLRGCWTPLTMEVGPVCSEDARGCTCPPSVWGVAQCGWWEQGEEPMDLVQGAGCGLGEAITPLEGPGAPADGPGTSSSLPGPPGPH